MTTGQRLLASAYAPLVWGSTYIVATALLPADRPFLAATVRALPAGLILLAVSRRGLTRGWLLRGAVLGIFMIGGFFSALFVAAYRLPGGMVATIGAMAPIVVLALSRLMLHRPTPLVKWVAAGVAVLGVALLVGGGGGPLDPIGLAAAIAAPVLMAIGSLLGNLWLNRPDAPRPLVLTGWQLTSSGLLLVPVMLAVEGIPPAPDARNLVGFGYLVLFGTALAYWLWMGGVRSLTPTQLAPLGVLSPCSAAVLGWIFADEILTGQQLLGFVLALAGSVAGSLLGNGRAAAPDDVRAPPRSAQ